MAEENFSFFKTTSYDYCTEDHVTSFFFLTMRFLIFFPPDLTNLQLFRSSKAVKVQKRILNMVLKLISIGKVECIRNKTYFRDNSTENSFEISQLISVKIFAEQ